MDKNTERLSRDIAKVVIRCATEYANHMVDINPTDDTDSGFRKYFVRFTSNFKEQLNDELVWAWAKGVF